MASQRTTQAITGAVHVVKLIFLISNKTMKIRERYKLNKAAKVGEQITCPSCGTTFEKTNYQQAFCKTKGGTKCKDKYWNTVTPGKRNNTTRISPANAAWQAKQAALREARFNPDDEEHPFSSEALGQWLD